MIFSQNTNKNIQRNMVYIIDIKKIHREKVNKEDFKYK